MHRLKIEVYLKFIFLVCLIAISSAYFIEYILGHQPCNLCLIERIPYGLGLILLISNFIQRRNQKFIIILLTLVFVFSLIISIYHFGIEQAFFEESAVCGLKDTSILISKEEILKQLQEKNVSCKDVTFKIFGLSLTSYNILISLLICISTGKIYFDYGKN